MLRDAPQHFSANLQPITLERRNGIHDNSSRGLLLTLYTVLTRAMSPKAMQAMKPFDTVVSANGFVAPGALQAMKPFNMVNSKNGPKDSITTKSERKKTRKIPAALQGIASTSHEPARPCTKHEAAVHFEAITTPTTPKRKRVTRALLQGIASASQEDTHACTSHETAAKRRREEFWENILPRWAELKQAAIQAGEKPPDFSKWCNARAHMQCVQDVWKDWS